MERTACLRSVSPIMVITFHWLLVLTGTGLSMCATIIFIRPQAVTSSDSSIAYKPCPLASGEESNLA
jgi:hypothetical protein